MTRRRTWLLVHRVNGLLLASFLTMVGATGAVLAWRGQLEKVFAPTLFVLPAHAGNAPRINPLVVRQNVALAYPWAEVDMLDLSTKPDVPLEFFLTPKTGGGSATIVRDDEAYADPYSGRVLGSRRDADLGQGWKNAIPFVYSLHESIALGDAGTTLLGVAALLWTLDCFIGMYLTFPASRRRVERSVLRRVNAWPRRWGPAWLIRWRQGSYKRLYDVHRASGLWLWSLLLVFAWTGVVFNLPAVARPVIHMFGGSAEPRLLSAGCSEADASMDEAGWRAALGDARGRMKDEAIRQGFLVKEERFLSYDRQKCVWIYRVRSTRDVDRIGNTQLSWANDVPQAAFTAPTGITRIDTLTTWMEAIHESQIGGEGFRVLVSVCGVVTALLSVTGVLIFVRKIRRRSPSRCMVLAKADHNTERGT